MSAKNNDILNGSSAQLIADKTRSREERTSLNFDPAVLKPKSKRYQIVVKSKRRAAQPVNASLSQEEIHKITEREAKLRITEANILFVDSADYSFAIIDTATKVPGERVQQLPAGKPVDINDGVMMQTTSGEDGGALSFHVGARSVSHAEASRKTIQYFVDELKKNVQLGKVDLEQFFDHVDIIAADQDSLMVSLDSQLDTETPLAMSEAAERKKKRIEAIKKAVENALSLAESPAGLDERSEKRQELHRPNTPVMIR